MLALRFPHSSVIGIDIRPPSPTELHLRDGIFANLARLTGDVYDDEIIANAMIRTPENGSCIVLGTHLCGDLSRLAVDMIQDHPEKISASIVAPCCLMRAKKPSKYIKGKGWGHDTTKIARERKIDPFELWLERLKDRAPVPNEAKTIVEDKDMISTKNRFIVIRRHTGSNGEMAEPVLCREVGKLKLQNKR